MRNEYDFSKGKRGRVLPEDATKTRITIRLDSDVLAWFRDRVEQAGGGSYQADINRALREYVNSARTGGMRARVAAIVGELLEEVVAGEELDKRQQELVERIIGHFREVGKVAEAV